MSSPINPAPIGDLEVDRLLALVPPPPLPPAELTDRIVAKATMTAQVPPLPPRRAPRGGRLRIGRAAWTGAVLGSFLLTIAAAAAVLGGHINLHRLAALPAALFGKHAAYDPARLGRAPSTPLPVQARTPVRPASAIAIKPRIIVEPPARPALLTPPPTGQPGEKILNRPALPRIGDRRPARFGHASVRMREPLVHLHPARVRDRRELRGSEYSPRAPSDKALRLAPEEDDAASANRDWLRAERSTERRALSATTRDSVLAERTGFGAGSYNGQRWGGHRRPGWRRREFGRVGERRGAVGQTPRPDNEADSSGTNRPVRERTGPTAPNERKTRGGGGARGKGRGRRR